MFNEIENYLRITGHSLKYLGELTQKLILNNKIIGDLDNNIIDLINVENIQLKILNYVNIIMK